ncbi:MAG: hypothetical protein U0670_05005 [Anaerolineae bacterium]
MARRRVYRSLGTLLLAIYLIVVGVSPLLNISLGIFVNILAVAAGVLLLLDLR